MYFCAKCKSPLIQWLNPSSEFIVCASVILDVQKRFPRFLCTYCITTSYIEKGSSDKHVTIIEPPSTSLYMYDVNGMNSGTASLPIMLFGIWKHDLRPQRLGVYSISIVSFVLILSRQFIAIAEAGSSSGWQSSFLVLLQHAAHRLIEQCDQGSFARDVV